MPAPLSAAERYRVTDKLRALVRLPTVADDPHGPQHPDTDATFEAAHAELARLFPRLHAALERIPLGRHGLLLRWPGRAAHRPLVLMAHLDVVPVDADAPWQHPAFGAEVVDGAIWGRGTLDDKGALVAVCEAVERLLERGHVPAQDVWLSFGADEEVSGGCARAAVEELRRRDVQPWLVLDEGGAVAHDAFPGVSTPVAVVGVGEKGTTTLELRVEGPGGHASTPPRRDTTARLARAIVRLDRSPFPARVPEPTLQLFERIAPLAPRPVGALLARSRRAAPLLARAMAALGPETAAMARTTAAVTTLEGSPASNVLASTARAGVNVRILPGDTVESVVRHVRRAVRDRKVSVTVLEAGEPSPLSPTVDAAFELVTSTVAEVFPDAVASPYIMTGATDARHFTAICPRVYRFAPFRMTAAQRAGLHSYDEHLGVDALAEGVHWYTRLIERLP